MLDKLFQIQLLLKLHFDTENFDVGGCYDTSNKRFVVPSGEAGKYVFEFLISVDGIDDAEFLEGCFI